MSENNKSGSGNLIKSIFGMAAAAVAAAVAAPGMAILVFGGVIVSAIGISIWATGKEQIGMAVLGMQQSGKTTWYDYLNGQNRHEKTTNKDIVDSFTMHLSDEKSVTIKKGIDIGGDKAFIKEHYEKMINDKENDFVIFFFNIEKYLNKIGYQRDVNSRLDLIYSILIKKITEEYEISKRVFIIMSYKDKLSNPDKSFKDVTTLLSSKKYSPITKQMYCVNMLDAHEKETIKKKIFYGK
jgi:hypothetical protein